MIVYRVDTTPYLAHTENTKYYYSIVLDPLPFDGFQENKKQINKNKMRDFTIRWRKKSLISYLNLDVIIFYNTKRMNESPLQIKNKFSVQSTAYTIHQNKNNPKAIN